MKIDTLAFIHCLTTSHPPEAFHSHMAVLIPPVVAAVGDSFYKITAEALLVLQQLVKVIRPLGESWRRAFAPPEGVTKKCTTLEAVLFSDPPSSFDFTPFTMDLYKCTVVRLKAGDIDQEVKERAISCMGQIICNLGDHLQVNRNLFSSSRG